MEGSKYFQSPKLYKENGFLKRETAQELINYLEAPLNPEEKRPDCTLIKIEKKKSRSSHRFYLILPSFKIHVQGDLR